MKASNTLDVVWGSADDEERGELVVANVDGGGQQSTNKCGPAVGSHFW